MISTFLLIIVLIFMTIVFALIIYMGIDNKNYLKVQKIWSAVVEFFKSDENYGLKVGDKLIDKRWQTTKITILAFAMDGSGWIKIRRINEHGTSEIVECRYEYISDYFVKLEKPQNV